MECIFDKEKLNKVLSDFYSSTGIAITLYDAAKNIVATLPIHSECCSYIRRYPDCVKNCNQSNLIHMKEVWEEREIMKYSCHAGIMETILPIIYEGILIAYLQIGQFKDEEQIYSSVQKIKDSAVKYGIDSEHLIDLYKRLPAVSEEKLNSIFSIIEILIKSFWQNGLITYKRSMLSIKIERYISTHITEKIYIDDICQEFYLSKNMLYRLFRTEFNTTVGDFITEKRLELARDYLRSDQNMSVSDIASACGFPDYNYFIRVFKKHFSLTPLKFKKSNLKSPIKNLNIR